jgi:predicted transcriptional regulator
LLRIVDPDEMRFARTSKESIMKKAKPPMSPGKSPITSSTLFADLNEDQALSARLELIAQVELRWDVKAALGFLALKEFLEGSGLWSIAEMTVHLKMPRSQVEECLVELKHLGLVDYSVSSTTRDQLLFESIDWEKIALMGTLPCEPEDDPFCVSSIARATGMPEAMVAESLRGLLELGLLEQVQNDDGLTVTSIRWDLLESGQMGPVEYEAAIALAAKE